MVRTQIQLTEEQAEKIKQAARERRISMADLIRQGVNMVLKSGNFPDIAERRNRALDIVGTFSSGRRDISQKHDEYLTDTIQK